MPNPLCPSLYARLMKVFGKVKIAHEGEEARIKHRRPILASVRTDDDVHTEVESAGEYYRVCCSFCGDDRYRLWIGHRWGEYEFMAVCYNENCLKVYANRKSLRNRVLTYLGSVALEVLPGKQVDERIGAAPPLGDIIPLRDLNPNHPARQYLTQRGYDTDYLSDSFGVGYVQRVTSTVSSFQSMNNRIYIPVHMHGLLVGWQGRYIGDPPKPGPPKYFTCPGFPKRLTLYNFDSASRYRTVVVCEGVTSAWSTGPDAVALLGKTVSSIQMQLLSSVWAKMQGTLVWSLDGDVGDISSSGCDEGPLRDAYSMMSRAFSGRTFCRLMDRGTDPGNFPLWMNRESIANWARHHAVPIPGFLGGEHG